MTKALNAEQISALQEAIEKHGLPISLENGKRLLATIRRRDELIRYQWNKPDDFIGLAACNGDEKAIEILAIVEAGDES